MVRSRDKEGSSTRGRSPKTPRQPSTDGDVLLSSDLLDHLSRVIKHPAFLIVLLFVSCLLVPLYAHFGGEKVVDNALVKEALELSRHASKRVDYLAARVSSLEFGLNTTIQAHIDKFQTELVEDNNNLGTILGKLSSSLKSEVMAQVSSLREEVRGDLRESDLGLYYYYYTKKDNKTEEESDYSSSQFSPSSSLGNNWALVSLGAAIRSYSPPRNQDYFRVRESLRDLSTWTERVTRGIASSLFSIEYSGFRLLSPEATTKLSLYVSAYPEILLDPRAPVAGESYSTYIAKDRSKKNAFVEISLGLKLKQVTHIALRHTSKASTVNPRSAPKNFRVSAVCENGTTTDKGSFQDFIYDGEALGFQVFPLRLDKFKDVSALRFEFSDSHGAQDNGVPFVTLHRLEIYGVQK